MGGMNTNPLDDGQEIDAATVEAALFWLAVRHAFVEVSMESRQSGVRPLRFSVWLTRD